MTVSLRLNDNDSSVIKAYAMMNGITVSELLRKCALEKIEDEFDLKAYDEAIKEYQNDPETYSLKDVIKELDL